MMVKKAMMILTLSVISLCMLMAAKSSDTESNETIRVATTLSGTVVDSTTREGIPQAQVILEEAGESTSTDEYGSFFFSDVEVGTHSISVEAVNYRPAQESIEVTEEGATIEIQLDPEFE